MCLTSFDVLLKMRFLRLVRHFTVYRLMFIECQLGKIASRFRLTYDIIIISLIGKSRKRLRSCCIAPGYLNCEVIIYFVDNIAFAVNSIVQCF